MLKSDLFIPKEMLVAPEHPLANNINMPLPDSSQSSLAEIRSKQQRDRIPGVVKRLIPFDTTTYWEYWWCVPGRLLLPEDVELLQRDRPRIEAIVAKLIWLFGGFCFGNDTCRDDSCQPIYDWQQILAFVQQQGIKPDFLDVDFLPLTIKPNYSYFNSKLDRSDSSYVAVEPNHWHVEFFQFQPTAGGFQLQEPKNVCSCQIWTGKPFIKHIATGEIITRYDLWVSQPIDLTIPPWQLSLLTKEP